MRVFGFIFTALLFIAPLAPAHANIAAVMARLDALEAENAALKKRIAVLERQNAAAPAPTVAIPSGTAAAHDITFTASIAAGTAPRWSRTYAGLQGGYALGEPEYPLLGEPFAGATFSGELEGASFGGQIGQTWQHGMFVTGVELQARTENIESATQSLTEYNFVENDDAYQYRGVGIATTEVSWSAAAKGRLGVATDSALLYATAGVTAAEVDEFYEGITIETINAIGPGGTGDGSSLVLAQAAAGSSSIQIGFIGGFGFEYALTENLSIGAEYEYTWLGDRGFSPLGADTALDWHTASARLNVSF